MRNKVLVVAIILLACSSLTAQDWTSNFKEAQRVAQQENKKVLLLFAGSDWCAPCMKLERFVLDTETFATYASKNYVLVKADFPRKKKNQPPAYISEQNAALAEKYNPNGYFPLLVMLNSEGVKLGAMGYKKIAPEAYINILKSWETR